MSALLPYYRVTTVFSVGCVLAIILALVNCGGPPRSDGIDQGMFKAFSPLPEVMASDENPVTPAKVALGHRLFVEPAMSATGDVSCNTCHLLDRYGVDGKAVSNGHHGATGTRNSPAVYNAAGHFVQFWDGRAATIEEQAEGPVTNPLEMAMSSPEVAAAAIRSKPGYDDLFRAAFPDSEEPVNFGNIARALGAFQRTLVTPSRWDDFLKGDDSALTAREKAGFKKFTETGCMTCHRGSYVGGEMYSRLGIIKAWPDTRDLGRYQVTRNERDRFIFKVPGLRNIEMTAPYLHDGSIATLEETIRIMAEYQLGKTLSDEDVDLIVAWLKTLTGKLPKFGAMAETTPNP